MKHLFRSSIALLITSFLLCGCNEKPTDIYHYSDSIKVSKVRQIPNDFIFGLDLSSVISLEKSGVKFFNFDNEEEDIFSVVKKCGTTHIRVRLWNNPSSDLGIYGGGNSDINTCVEIAKRCNAVGLKLIVDFHYSDFWADPGKQKAPKAWQEMGINEKVNALKTYTLESLNALKSINTDVSVIQMGNEINSGLSGETSYENIARLLRASYDAIKEVYPNSLTAVHYTDPQNKDDFLWRLDQLDNYNVKYDIIGTSYYPYWHGEMSKLKDTLNSASKKYNKKVMVLETSYAHTLEDTDFHENTIKESSTGISKPYDFSVQGQANEIRDVIDTVKSSNNGINNEVTIHDKKDFSSENLKNNLYLLVIILKSTKDSTVTTALSPFVEGSMTITSFALIAKLRFTSSPFTNTL